MGVFWDTFPFQKLLQRKPIALDTDRIEKVLDRGDSLFQNDIVG
jgi:hypothetical protein